MKKQINAALIVIVIGLWGTAAYKFLGHYFDKQELVRSIDVYSKPIHKTDKDTFLLKKISRDPFLNRGSNDGPPKRTVRKMTSRVITSAKNISLNTSFPSMEYFGYIKSGDKQRILLKVNGKLLKLHELEINRGLTIKKVYRDSVLVVFEGEPRIIRRN